MQVLIRLRELCVVEMLGSEDGTEKLQHCLVDRELDRLNSLCILVLEVERHRLLVEKPHLVCVEG